MELEKIALFREAVLIGNVRMALEASPGRYRAHPFPSRHVQQLPVTSVNHGLRACLEPSVPTRQVACFLHRRPPPSDELAGAPAASFS